MQGKDPTRDAKLAILAGKQHGVVAYWQLIALAFSPGAIEHALATGRLHRMYKGVYSVGYQTDAAEAWEMAAVLKCGPEAVLSHWTATSRWQLLRPRQGPVHVSVPSDRRVPGIRTHHVQRFHPNDRTKRDGIPITSVPRTLLDLAAVAPLRQLQRAVNEADRRGWLNRSAIAELLERNPRRHGRKALVAVIASVSPGTRRTRSDLETAFLLLLENYRLPQPLVNAKVAGIEVDMHWPGARPIVELDSYEYHRTQAEFENDRQRDARLKLAGYEVLRVTDTWLIRDPTGVAETVRALLTN
jgi:very-short-patch-repair endonuclease